MVKPGRGLQSTVFPELPKPFGSHITLSQAPEPQVDLWDLISALPSHVLNLVWSSLSMSNSPLWNSNTLRYYVWKHIFSYFIGAHSWSLPHVSEETLNFDFEECWNCSDFGNSWIWLNAFFTIRQTQAFGDWERMLWLDEKCFPNTYSLKAWSPVQGQR